MEQLERLKREIGPLSVWARPSLKDIYLARGYDAHLDDPNVIARAWADAALFSDSGKYIYENDLIAGSLTGILFDGPESEELIQARRLVDSYGTRQFRTNNDHFAPDYATFLSEGVDGTIARIGKSREAHADDAEALEFLDAMEIEMRGLSAFIEGYARAAWRKADECPARRQTLAAMAEACGHVVHDAPRTFREALQLMWLVHLAFRITGRSAMALGRVDQFLYPFFERDLAAGRLTEDEASELLACAFYKIGDDTVNIAIGGVNPDGTDALNRLSYAVLHAVGACNIPGPNLSARIHSGTAEDFLDECLRVIGTGLGYPALMNDEVNIPALMRYGYAVGDARDYCMVGCIENFLQGRQPPWSDGRFNTPKYIELTLNRGVCMLTGVRQGPDTGDPASFATMGDFMAAFEAQLRHGASRYMRLFYNQNESVNPKTYKSPLLSCFCRDCIGRAKDINEGGALYPSVHGACCMGIATVSDSLAAIEKLVFETKRMTLSRLAECLKADFKGCEEERRLMLAAPKYGNDDEYVDKYAVWFVEKMHEIFSRYRTRDGGGVYLAMAANTQNISAGREVAATPDGRRACEALNDAASPMHGRDKNGPTAVALSTTKPDYSLVACGTVLNQKYSPVMFQNNQMREKLRALIRVYFARGGQEMQINAVSRAVLMDASEHPENYGGLVVRVSGFSAFYTSLSREVQEDILQRTEHS
ncbi:MAG: hypothetical protein J5998_05030 [Clostridia bacterium]|nr:hypothetical protein [Clostridia bacterium]